MEAKLAVVVVECRVELVRPMAPATVDDHHALFAGCAKGRHHLMAIWAPLLGLKGLCRKFAFETICAMVSPGDLRCAERENDDGDQFQGSPFSAGYYSDGGAVVCRLSLELPTCRRAHAGTRRAG